MTTTFDTLADFQKAKVAVETDNPRLCLSPQRYMGFCFKCPIFKTSRGEVCESALIVKDKMREIEQMKADREKYKGKLKEIDKKLREIDEKLKGE